MSLNNTKAFSLVEMMVALALTGLMAMGALYLITTTNHEEAGNNEYYWANQMRNEVFMALRNDTAWIQTVAKASNVNLDCLNKRTSCLGKQGPFDLYDSAGTQVVSSINPQGGFSNKGIACAAFDGVNGNDDCPFRVQITWTPICEAANVCVNPEPFIHVVFLYKAVHQDVPINMTEWGFDLIKPVQIATLPEVCTSLGTTFDAQTGQCNPGSLNLFQCGADKTPVGITGTQVMCQPSLTQTCPPGQIAQGFYPDGTINCVPSSCAGGDPGGVTAQNCVGSWSTCTGGFETFNITTLAKNGGIECSFADGATKTCGSNSNCSGTWSSCVGGVQEYQVQTRETNGGGNCPFSNGASRTCAATATPPPNGNSCSWVSRGLSPSVWSCSNVDPNSGRTSIACTQANQGQVLPCYSFQLTCNCGAATPPLGPTPTSAPSCVDIANGSGGGFFMLGTAAKQVINAVNGGHSWDPDYADQTTCLNKLVTTQSGARNYTEAQSVPFNTSNFSATSGSVSCSCTTDVTGPGTWVNGTPPGCWNCYYSQFTQCNIKRCN